MGCRIRLAVFKLLASCAAMLAICAPAAAHDGEKQVSDGIYMQGAAWGRSGSTHLRLYSELNNHRSGATNPLRLSAWLSVFPGERGGDCCSPGHRLAVFEPIAGLPAWTSLRPFDQTAPVTPPAEAGHYYVVIVLEEHRPELCSSADGFCLRDSIFSATRSFWEAAAPPPSEYSLHVNIVQAVGFVTFDPPGTPCNEYLYCRKYPRGTSVTVTPVGNVHHTPNAWGWATEFAGWTGPCTGTAPCTVTMDSSKSLDAHFRQLVTDISLEPFAPQGATHTEKDIVISLRVRNLGQMRAANVRLAGTSTLGRSVWLFPGCTLVVPGFGTTNRTPQLGCELGHLEAGAWKDVKVVLRAASPGDVTVDVRALTGSQDPASGNDRLVITVPVSTALPGQPVARYRLYSPVTLEHHFTTDLNEYNTLGTHVGTWIQEGMAGRVLDNPGSYNGVVAVPYYRLYDNSTRWHHWTTDPNEYYTLSLVPGWSAEGTDGFILPTQAQGAIPLYRLLYPFIGGLHHWTIDGYEANTLVQSYGWILEGGSGYVLP